MLKALVEINQLVHLAINYGKTEPMKHRIFHTTLALALLAASSAHAGLIGEQVTGRISFGGGGTNYFDPANGYVPAGFLNVAGATVTIADPAQEFGFEDSANRDIADFTDSQLVISDEVFSSAASWLMTFTSVNAGLFQGLSLVTDNFTPGLTYSLSGDTITIQWAGTNSEGNFQAVFDVRTASVPEPGALSLLGAGLVALGFCRRRKR